MKLRIEEYTLHFHQVARTSRSTMANRKVWYFILEDKGKTGVGECALLPGLSPDNEQELKRQFQQLESDPDCCLRNDYELKKLPALKFAVEMALKDLKEGGRRLLFPSLFTNQVVPIKINGLIWMGSYETMLRQIEEKLAEGWRCIKLKIGSLEFKTELKLLQQIRSRFNRDQLELRVDANGAFTPGTVMDRLEHLAQFELHSIEQPLQPGNWEFLAEICHQTPLPIALDEELIACRDSHQREVLLDRVRPHFLVLKPTLLGGFKDCEDWIKLAEERGIGWWITSALESNIGLNAIAQWTATKKNLHYQGLGTGQLYSNNFPSPLRSVRGELWYDQGSSWNLSALGL
ncbi:MAG: o-succinylbenzoate synthase [Fidelibacterota bacterium]